MGKAGKGHEKEQEKVIRNIYMGTEGKRCCVFAGC